MMLKTPYLGRSSVRPGVHCRIQAQNAPLLISGRFGVTVDILRQVLHGLQFSQVLTLPTEDSPPHPTAPASGMYALSGPLNIYPGSSHNGLPPG